jgi:hypothetical protein
VAGDLVRPLCFEERGPLLGVGGGGGVGGVGVRRLLAEV